MGLARALPSVAENTRKWATTGLGLGVIPFIVHPIDSFVHLVMDNTTRYQAALNNAQLSPLIASFLNKARSALLRIISTKLARLLDQPPSHQ